MKYSVNGTKPLFYSVLDISNHRVLIWFSDIPKGAEPANVVLGQPDFYSGTANNNGPSASSLSGPLAMETDGSHLFVADSSNNRVLIWNSIPTQSSQPADIVIGQPDFTQVGINTGGQSARSIRNPYYVATDGTKLVIAELGNDRVLIFNSIPTQTFAAADVVVGQAQFTSSVATTAINRLFNPTSAIMYKGKLIIADKGGARVVIFNSIPTANNASADVVVGQTNFTNNTLNNGAGAGSPNQTGMDIPRGVIVIDDHLIVSDTANNRILIWNTIPTTNGKPADVVLGQPDFTTATVDNTPGSPGTVSAYSLNGIQRLATDGKKLIVPESNHSRFLIWNSVPTRNQQPADFVFGQPDFSSSQPNYSGTLGAVGFSHAFHLCSNFSTQQGVWHPGGF